MFWKKHKWKIILPVCLIALLAFAFWYGGDAPGLQGWKAARRAPEASDALSGRPGGADGTMSAEDKLAYAAALAGEQTGEQGDAEYSAAQGMQLDPNTGLDKYGTAAVPEGKPVPVEPESVKLSDIRHKCTISINCARILDNMDWLDPEKVELVPEDGWILKPVEVEFLEGESVFDVLRRTCRQQGIHLEFSKTPMYNSAYIEGIHNLYEFDCGQLSGWVYKVNGWGPNYGCSRYGLKEGDVIEWLYTCDLGIDVDAYVAAGG
ncbi:MAG: DUF4430 domain-containing protein [Clostridia bacterium]|nr:DUF4430 domain-containing protein [Clostridia bacterium]